MFTAIRNWWRSRKLRRHRLIFEYWDGRRFRRIDPWKAYRAIADDQNFNQETMLEAALRGDAPECDYFCGAICKAFGVKPFDELTGEGLTEYELAQLYDDLAGFFFALKKNGLTFSTSAEVGDSASSTSTDSATPSAENSPSRLSIVSDETNCEEETQSHPQFATPTTR